MKYVSRIILGITASVFLASCGYQKPTPPPKVSCTDAKACSDILPLPVDACGWSAESPIDTGKWGTVRGAPSLSQWRLYNFHATRDITTVIEVRIESQLPEGPNVKTYPYLIKAKPKDANIKGGRPDEIDFAGPYRYLGCEWVRKADNTITRYTYEVKSACFVDDPACPTQQPPYEKPVPRPPVEDELARCNQACNSNDPAKCYVYDLHGPDARVPARELGKIAQALRQSQIPFGLDMSPLLDAVSAASGKSCQGRQLTIGEQSEVVAFGQACRFQLAVSTGTPGSRSLVLMDIPNVISGAFTRTGTAPILPKIQWSAENAPTVDFYGAGPNGGITSSEPLLAMYMSSSQMLFAGKKDFCAKVLYPGG